MAKAKKLTESQVVGTSLLVSVSDIILNFIVALITGSAVMMSQALQGLSDVTTAGFLYLGVRRSRSVADRKHPFGYGRELFFWTLIAAVFMFIGTGGLSIYFGYQQIINPQPVEHIGIAFAMLCFGLTTNVFALSRSVRRLKYRGKFKHTLRDFFSSGMIETKTTFFVDSMGSVAALFGIVSLSIYLISGNVVFDGIGAVIVGTTTMTAAVAIMFDVKGLITGRAVSQKTLTKIIRSTLKVEGVEEVLDLHTMYIGSTNLLVIVEVHLQDELTTNQIEKISDEIKQMISKSIPDAKHVQIEVETPDHELVD